MSRIVIQVVTRGAERAARQVEGVGRAGQRSARGINVLRGALAGLGVASVARELIQLSDASTRINNRLNLLTGSQTVTNERFRQLGEVARTTRSDLESTVDLYSRLQRSSQDLGLTSRELIDLTTGVNQAFQIYGNTAAEAEAATIQFSQGLAAGALRGDELRSVLEQAPRLAQAIAAGLTEIEALGPGVRVGIGQLRDLGREGVLTAENVTEALQTQLGVLNQEFAQTIPTLANAFTLLRNEALTAFRSVTEGGTSTEGLARTLISLGEAIQPTFEFLVSFLNLLTETFTTVQSFATSVLGPTTVGFIGLAAAIGLVTAALGLNPLAALALGGLAAVTAIRELENATDEITVATRTLNGEIETEIAQSETLAALLESGGIQTQETAEAKLRESRARQENIMSLQEEARAQIRLQEVQLRAQVAAAQAAIANAGASRFSIGGTVINIDPLEEARLIRLQSEAINASRQLEMLRANSENLERQLSVEQSTDRGIVDLQENGNLPSTQAAQGQREAADEVARAAQRASDESQRLAERQANSIRIISEEIAAIQISAGTGSDALRDLLSASERIDNQERRNQISASQAAEARIDIERRLGEARNQTAQDLVNDLARERSEANLTEAQRDALNRVRQSGLDPSLNQGLVASLAQELQLVEDLTEAEQMRAAAAERRQELIGGLGSRDTLAEIAEEFQTLSEVVNNEQGLFGQDQIADAERGLAEIGNRLREIRLEAGEGSITDGFLSGIQDFAEGGGQVLQEFGMQLAGVTEQLAGGFGDAIAGAIVDGENLGEALKSVARDALSQLISGLVQLGVQFLVNQAISATAGAAAVGIASAQAGALATAFAPAAALASLASFGANALPAGAALTSTNILSQSLARSGGVPGFADGGFVSGPGGPREDAIPAMLSNGEFVVNAAATRQNRGLLEALNSGSTSGVQADAARRVTINMNVSTNDADSFRRNQRQITNELRGGLERR